MGVDLLMRIHHIGYAVKRIEQAAYEFELLGYTKEGNQVVDKERNIKIQFMSNNNYYIELITPISNSAPIYNMLKKFGNTPYHICYETKNIEETIKNLTYDGYVLIEPIKEAKAINNRRVAFLANKDIGIIELVEE